MFALLGLPCDLKMLCTMVQFVRGASCKCATCLRLLVCVWCQEKLVRGAAKWGYKGALWCADRPG